MLAILGVIHWFVTNDGPGDETHGIFAMKPTAGAKAARKRRERKKFSPRPDL
jgi:hypothetical protein